MADIPVDLPIRLLIESPDNAQRGRFDEKSLAELAESIREDGVLQAITVRKIPAPNDKRKKDPGLYEIIFGARRRRAAEIALGPDGLIPCVVKEMSDSDAVRLRIIENAQRVDVHPLDEAYGFAKLIHLGEFDVKTLSEKIGKGETYVRSRIALTRLSWFALKAYEQGLLLFAHASVIATLRPEDQKAATEYAIGPQSGDRLRITHYDGKPQPVQSLRGWVRNSLAPDLMKAPFDMSCPDLNPEQGPCTTCEHRSGYGLFEEFHGEDRCLHRACFQVKLSAHVDRVRKKAEAEAEARGQKLVLVSSSYSPATEGAISNANWHRCHVPAGEVSEHERVSQAFDSLVSALEADGDQVHEIELDPESYEAIAEWTRQELIDGEYEPEFMEEFEGAVAAGRFEEEENGVFVVRSESGHHLSCLDKQEPSEVVLLPPNAVMALMVDGPQMGQVIPVQITGLKSIAKDNIPEELHDRQAEERSARKEQLRLQKAEKLARKRIFDQIRQKLADMDATRAKAWISQRAVEIIAIAAVKVAQGEFSSNVDASGDTYPFKHPGRREARTILGLESRREAAPDILKLGPSSSIDAFFVACTHDEIGVGERKPQEAHGLALWTFAKWLEIDVEAVRRESDWDTLSKRAQAERLKQKEAPVEEPVTANA